jgi:hypothetical protein
MKLTLLNAAIKFFRATLPAKIFLLEILIFKGITARRPYESFGVKWLNFHGKGKDFFAADSLQTYI